MEPILDETTLVPCTSWSPASRLGTLATLIKALDDLGAPRVLRSVRDAVDRDIGSGRGLRAWCFQRETNREAGLLIANRLTRQPFVDGPGGLFAIAEGAGAVVSLARGTAALGLGLAALTDNAAIALSSESTPGGSVVPVRLTFLEESGERTESASVLCIAVSTEVEQHRSTLLECLDRLASTGPALLERARHMFPRLRFGSRAHRQITAMTGTEPLFRQLLRHLRALDLGARDRRPDTPFSPVGGLSWSDESNATLDDGKLGPMRDFPAPEGFAAERWRYHTKLTGGAGARMYFRSERSDQGPVVLIGYVGDHLPTVKFR
jgi:hypothetical protein